ncbi:hypothetical protein GPECTOR_10g804 [Gonium pectorale]|uniref:Uncharacterized protein n=1 Tax=Gonium pectorale TaxID=33097 RepID=A0A150GQS0_GONPE|nr:hypothetical protein GPECTOR_10g804 [Gonium pectorale]|eukprot:KXZ52175.1 hypothetical protein GPECTOR_10g804 [Gonium pectorale]
MSMATAASPLCRNGIRQGRRATSLVSARLAPAAASAPRPPRQALEARAAAALPPRRTSQAAAGRRRRSRATGAVQVVAFRDAHRAEQLLDTAREFVGYWMLGRQEGPTSRVMAGMAPLLAQDCTAELHGLLLHTVDQGPDGIARLLSGEHRPAGLTLKHWHSRVCAANEDTDTVFCLVEMRAEDAEGTPRSCYQLLKLELMLDDTVRRVTHLLERGQWDCVGDGLTPLLLAEAEEAGPAAITAAEQQPAGAGGAQEGQRSRPRRVRSTRAGGDVVGSDLPVERIATQSQIARYTRGLSPDALRDISRVWCAARCSGTDARGLLEPRLAPDFRLWDAYGLLPLVCSIKDRPADQAAAAAASTLEAAGPSPSGFTMAMMMGGGGCVAPREAVFDILENAKAEYDVQVTPLDLAVSYTHNVVFCHWKTVMKPKQPGAAAQGAAGEALPLEQEGVEVDIFNSEGLLSDVWMFRDALDFEKHMMMARRQQLAQHTAQHGNEH